MVKGIDISIRDLKGNEARFDDERLDAAQKQYDQQISGIDSAEHDELVRAYAKYAATLDAFKAEQSEMNAMAKDFNAYWGTEMSEYEKDIRQAVKIGSAMRRQKGVKDEDVAAFAHGQQRIIEDKHKDILADYNRACANAESLRDGFKAKWEGNPDIAAYQEEYAAIRKKYKKLRRAVEKPNPLNFIFLTKVAPRDSSGSE